MTAIRDRLLSCCLEGWREDAGETEHSEQESWKPRSTNLSESRRGTQPIESLYTLKCESASMGFSTRRRGHLRDCENFAKVGLQLYSEQCPHESVLCSECGGPGLVEGGGGASGSQTRDKTPLQTKIYWTIKT